MNLKHLVEAVQHQHYFEAKAEADAELKALKDAAVEVARAKARTDGEALELSEAQIKIREHRAGKAVQDPKLDRDLDGAVPTRAWCERMVKKHAKAAREENAGDRRAFRDDLLARVKADPDIKDKKPKKEKP